MVPLVGFVWHYFWLVLFTWQGAFTLILGVLQVGEWPLRKSFPIKKPLRIALCIVLLFFAQAAVYRKLASEYPEGPFAATLENPQSLRQRTLRLSDDLQNFYIKHPEPREPGIPEAQQHGKSKADYWDSLKRDYMRNLLSDYATSGLKGRTLEILSEYKAKEIEVPGLTDKAQNSPLTDIGSEPTLTEFRDLGYRVDATDAPIQISKI